jgi:poly(A) polymerase
MKKVLAQTRQFAEHVVRVLRDAGYEALFAGGCVRDQLLNITPSDYDVATNARPEKIREIFGKERTLAIGAAFGVITILGPREAGQIEVATFRCDGAYIDGRRPTEVIFSTAEQDAQRRDFTINGLFYDPLENRVFDYVGGQADLENRVLRAIGNAHDRFREDKLRLLRAIRFAARFNLQIENTTWNAVCHMASDINVVSVERIAAELRRMLLHVHATQALELMRDSGILFAILPFSQTCYSKPSIIWKTMLKQMGALPYQTFSVSLAILLRPICHEQFRLRELPILATAGQLCRNWKLSNEETELVQWLMTQEETILNAPHVPWPTLQRVLVAPHIEQLLNYTEALLVGSEQSTQAIEYCRQQLQLPLAELNPPLIITGDELIRLGFRPGPQFKSLLEALRNAQLEKRIITPQDAITYAHELYKT